MKRDVRRKQNILNSDSCIVLLICALCHFQDFVNTKLLLILHCIHWYTSLPKHDFLHYCIEGIATIIIHHDDDWRPKLSKNGTFFPIIPSWNPQWLKIVISWKINNVRNRILHIINFFIITTMTQTKNPKISINPPP